LPESNRTEKKTMHAVQVPKGGAAFEFVERDIPTPGAGEVRVKVEACGVCHSDALVKEGWWPGIRYPRVPGHEIAGVVDAVGQGVQGWAVGDRAGVGWYGGHCGYCERCRRGDIVACLNGKITGISFDGGYAEYAVTPAQALARIPAEIPAADAGPLLCAGITTFNSMRNAGARAGDTVAVLGIGGLGHLAVQYAAKMGFRTVAIARGADKAPLARQLGAHEYIDSQTQDPSAELQKSGGAQLIVATVTSGQAMTAALGGLAIGGKFLVLGAPPEPLQVNGLSLLAGRRTVAGWPSGSSIDSEDTMKFSAMTGVRSMNEIYPLERAAEAYERMLSGKARFRVVLTMA
jgi:D-arabinose 1-dehydrogenase-like Zn-dependent alcohol dehydrogenase